MLVLSILSTPSTPSQSLLIFHVKRKEHVVKTVINRFYQSHLALRRCLIQCGCEDETHTKEKTNKLIKVVRKSKAPKAKDKGAEIDEAFEGENQDKESQESG